ncbi:MAG: hypothetical protein AUI15_32500 [Actinobacteria bacterium 13_2_20CM_2_66_6]|nr:MAG: hypothetical protein AUI15_32500 [Actinobacteria bacterium 13_2_20CM_2_66_6]
MTPITFPWICTVVDVVFDHRLTANAKDERLATTPRRELTRQGHRLGAVLVRVDGLARGDLADDRRLDRPDPKRAGKA